MLTTSARRVTVNTTDACNERIRHQTEMNLAYYEAHPDEIDRRLSHLDREWDIERVVETNSAILTLSGLVLGIGISRKWLLLSLAVQGFFLQHALQGWCPPIPILRRLGVRTQAEIEEERYALKALRGDFQRLAETPREGNGHRSAQAIEAVRV